MSPRGFFLTTPMTVLLYTVSCVLSAIKPSLSDLPLHHYAGVVKISLHTEELLVTLIYSKAMAVPLKGKQK